MPAPLLTDDVDPESLLRDRFHLQDFRPGQREVITALRTHGAALAVFPTGGGKSLCYQLPALAFAGITVVVSPLIALMKDQIDYLQRLGIPAERMDSSLGPAEARQAAERLRSGALRLLYVAPERFNNERFLEDLRHVRIGLFAVDEAHCISEWGHNFRPDYLKLAETARELGAERVLALTATATPSVVQDICAGFAIPADCAIVTGLYRPNLVLHTTPVSASERDQVLLQRVGSRPAGPTIVYVTLQKTAEQVADRLAAAGFAARAYHAGMDADARTGVQEWWMASSGGIVVATIAFGMGIDKADVRYVYHYNLPKSLESYSQEIGRAGRDGERSIVELLVCPSDVPTLENFAYGDTPTRAALTSVVDELLDAGPTFDLSVADMASRHDVRQLVLRTILTYLELLGVLRQGTPFYAGYEAKPLIPLPAILERLTGEPRRFLAAVFAAAKRGRVWYSLNPAEVAAGVGSDRERVLRALHYLEEHALIELRASEPRLRFARLDTTATADSLVVTLAQRFQRREDQEMARIQQVLTLADDADCQTTALVAHFGEQLASPCGHCTACEANAAATGTPRPNRRQASTPPPPDAIERQVDAAAFAALCDAHPDALGDARQQARFLCGLSSPAVTSARLSRNPLYGTLEQQRFADVLSWCERRSSLATL